MSSCCDKRNPLFRNGVSQPERLLKALVPSHVQIDERRLADLLSFARASASLINYYDLTNKSRGNWQGFFDQNISVLLAVISTSPYKYRQETIDGAIKDFEKDETKDNARTLTEALFSLAAELQHWNLHIPSNHPLKSLLSAEIRNSLRDALHTLGSADKSLPAPPVLDDEDSPFPEKRYGIFETDDWFQAGESFAGLPEISIADAEDLRNLVELLKDVYRRFFGSYLAAIGKSGDLFAQGLVKNDGHEPHITLFISFLRLFKLVQRQLNSLGKKHLDFYYREVLRLQKQEQIPDQAHILFQLAENYTSQALPAGTLLKAGKDDEGGELFYALTQDVTVNKASVSQLKSLRLSSAENYKLYAAPVANSEDGLGGAFAEGSQGNWKLFGSSGNPEIPDSPLAAAGIAIASPMLLLGEGDRNLKIRLNFDSELAISDLLDCFTIQLSTAEEWLEIKEYQPGADRSASAGFCVRKQDARFSGSPDIPGACLFFEIMLHSEDAAVIPFSGELLEGGYDTGWPMIKILLKQEGTGSIYGSFFDKMLKTIDIKADVEGIRSLILHNDQSVFTTDNSFLPFGPVPSLGANFYIGSQEAFSKKLDSLSVVIDWLDLPAGGDFEKHYCVYNTVLGESLDNGSFKVQVDYLENKTWVPLHDGSPQNLFNSPEEGFKLMYQFVPSGYVYALGVDTFKTSHSIQVLKSNPALQKTSDIPKKIQPHGTISDLIHDSKIEDLKPADPVYEACGKVTDAGPAPKSVNVSVLSLKDGGIDAFPRSGGILSLDKYTPDSQRGYLRLQLAGKDFQHGRYAEVYTKQAIKLAAGATDDTTTVFPNQPYTPHIKSIYLNYESSLTISCEGGGEADADQLYHIYPFGHAELFPAEGDIPGLPQFSVEDLLYTEHFYIGLQNAEASQIVTLLFQMLEGSGYPEADVPQIHWLYLSGGVWKSFADADILTDTTNSLVKSGIVSFQLPADITSGSTIMDGSLLWIKAAIAEPESSQALPDCISVSAQAAIAEFKDKNNSPIHLATALPAETITKLARTRPGIKAVIQPFASFGGNTAESDGDYYRRVSERLRHKGRAVSIWDYERLVLQEFPSIHRVKCINHCNTRTEMAPGCVMMVVIPDLRNKNAVDMLEPKVDKGTLEDIRCYLAERNTMFVKGSGDGIHQGAREALAVLNPLYEKVRIEVRVKMKPNHDPQYYRKQLNDDLKAFLAPWAYDSGADIGFGSSLHKSTILQFIEERPYIDFLTHLRLQHFDDCGVSLGYKDEIITGSARSILTSYGETDSETGLEHGIRTDAGCPAG